VKECWYVIWQMMKEQCLFFLLRIFKKEASSSSFTNANAHFVIESKDQRIIRGQSSKFTRGTHVVAWISYQGGIYFFL
jgi:hypothetical protein